MNKRIIFIITAMLSATALAPGMAHAKDEAVINGLIEQTANIKNTLELKQRQAAGSIQAVNLVGAGDRLVVNGTVRQTVNAASVSMEQRQAVGSTQALNAVLAGNPAASGLGL